MTKPEVIIVDVDGTVCDCEHRRKYIDNVIRVGDTVYFKGIANSKLNPFTLIEDEGNGVVVIEHNRIELKRKVTKEELRKKLDYKAFFENAKDDPPIQTTIDILQELQKTWPVVFMSGRPDTYRSLTEGWLNLNTFIYPYTDRPLFMRAANDMRQDYLVKKELYLTHIAPYYTVKCVFDDRKQVVDMWRSLGLTCYQVAEGNF